MKKLWGLVLWLVLIGCADGSTGTPVSAVPAATKAPPPTLAPTFTPPSSPAPLPTFTALPTQPLVPTETAVSFDETTVELHYRIPAIGLDRRLQGNVGGQLIVVDETIGLARQYNNQGGILLELRGALPELTLEPVPESCTRCVALTFSLPLKEISGSGWLQDDILLASLERYMAATLTPHFPPETVLGLRRGPSPYAPAHTLAVTADGLLWRWLATDTTLPEPVSVETAAPDLLSLLAAAPVESLDERYAVSCPGMPAETLLLQPPEVAESVRIEVACPAFTLPSTLVSLYAALDQLLDATVADVSVSRPPLAFPLTAVLDYRRADDARLTVYRDGSAVAVSGGEVVTSTLETTAVISLTNSLIDNEQVQPGLQTFLAEPTATITPTTTVTPSARSQLVVRGPAGVYDADWGGIPPLPALNDLLDSLLGLNVPVAETPSPPAEVITDTEQLATPTLTPTP